MALTFPQVSIVFTLSTDFCSFFLIKLQKFVHICGYELPTNLQNFMLKDLTELKIFQEVLGGGLLFSETPCRPSRLFMPVNICEQLSSFLTTAAEKKEVC